MHYSEIVLLILEIEYNSIQKNVYSCKLRLKQVYTVQITYTQCCGYEVI